MSTPPDPHLADWLCLALLSERPTHGWTLVGELKPEAEIGRVWHVSRALTYRSLDRLERWGWIEPVAQESAGGPNRTIMRPTRRGRAALRRWFHRPTAQARDLRSELLSKLVLADRLGIDLSDMLAEQRQAVANQIAELERAAKLAPDDVVTRWRLEITHAAARFLHTIPH